MTDDATRQAWTLRVVCVSTALLLLNVAAPQVAQTAIAESLGASFTDLQWVLSGYALALAVFLLTAGSLADRFGRRRLFLIGLTMFSAASLLCALAPGAGALIAARILQGLGAAVVFPSSLAILAEAFQGAERRRAIGAWGATIGLAFAAGPLIGGLLVDTVGWRGVFATSFVLGAPTLMLALRHVQESRDPDPPPVDWAGVGTLSLGLFAGVFAVLRGNALGWTSTTVLGCLALCAVALAAFVAVERRDRAADARPRAVRQPHVHRGDGDHRAAGGRAVRRVRVRGAVPARGAGPRPDRGGARCWRRSRSSRSSCPRWPGGCRSGCRCAGR